MAAYGPITTIDPALANSASPYGSDNSVASMLTGNGIPTGTQFQHINDGGFLSALDNIIKYGAIAGGSVAAGAGGLGLGSPGPGAEAIGGSAADLGGAAAGAGGGASLSPGITSGTFEGGGGYAPTLDPTGGAGLGSGTFGDGAPITSGGTGGLSYGGDALPFDQVPSLPSSAFNGSTDSGLLQGLLGNKDLVSSAIKAIGGLAGGGPAQSQPGAGGAMGGAYGSGGGGRSFSTLDPGTLGMPQPKVSPLTYNAIQPGQTSPMLLAQVLRGMSG